ncbi:MAG: hypothetical protein ACJ74J_09790 [Blastocatellia bacterium]
MARPSVSDIANGRGVVVRVLRVGVDGIDKEINAAECGAASPVMIFSSSETKAGHHARF